VRQLSGYAFTEHGIRANDSMCVRAALCSALRTSPGRNVWRSSRKRQQRPPLVEGLRGCSQPGSLRGSGADRSWQCATKLRDLLCFSLCEPRDRRTCTQAQRCAEPAERPRDRVWSEIKIRYCGRDRRQRFRRWIWRGCRDRQRTWCRGLCCSRHRGGGSHSL